MAASDFLRWVWRALSAQWLRSTLTLAGMAIGITAVCLMSALGEGARRYLLAEFTQFGSHLMAVTPGKTETFGLGGVLTTIRPLSLADAEALVRLPGIERVVPVVFGTARVSHGRRGRHVNVGGVGPAALDVWRLRLSQGRFLPEDELQNPRAFTVLGSTLKRELFGSQPALGEFVHIGSARFRVVGVLAPKGQFMGTDLDDTAYIPAAKGLALFNRDSLMEVDLVYNARLTSEAARVPVERLLRSRHGLDDFTLITQDEVLASLDKILAMLKYAGAALGAVSLLVGGVGILTIMLIVGHQRVQEIGLLRALGATGAQVRNLFIGEAVALALLGCLAGLVLTLLLLVGLQMAAPDFPAHLPVQAVVIALGLSVLIGVTAGVYPATHAARLSPVEALRPLE
ncbi:ABC transporter permease [Motiliproteus sp. SC1-56]|uniref:ABC transporter permease n=1 Tax=Motiliproteus sp. SC1-56 TaxID=2799565 RepID=UPI001A8F80E5|nr:ABC transporter permease [Motiliproteus sp. SC1-56]